MIWKLGVVLLIGYVVIGILMAFDPQRPPLEWKSAVWLPVWLLGLPHPWQGQYDGGAIKSPVNTNNIPFWWDIVVVAAFAVIIYFWAMRTKLSRAEMQSLVDRQSAEHDPAPISDL